MVRQRVRIRFCKRGDLRLIGHRDLMRSMERLFRRAGLSLGMSQGFHPKPRMTFPLALAVGIEGVDEVMEFELAESCTSEGILERVAPQCPPGLAISSVEILPPGSKKARPQAVRYRVPIPPEHRAGLAARIDRLLAASSCPIRRHNRAAPVDLRARLEELAFCDGVLWMRLEVGVGAGVGPRDVLSVLCLDELEHEGVYPTRTAVEIADRMPARRSCRPRKHEHETRNVDQRVAAGGMPDCHR